MASSSIKTKKTSSKIPKSSNEYDKNVPLPVILRNSNVIADKYEDYLRKLSKEYPSTIRKIDEEKKKIREKKNLLTGLVENIKMHIKEMLVATMHLDILYGNERQMEAEKVMELMEQEALLRESNKRKDVILQTIKKFSLAINVLNTLARTNGCQSAKQIVEYYLTVEALNEQFLELELSSMNKMKDAVNQNLELYNLTKDQMYKVMKCQGHFEASQLQLEKAKNINFTLQGTLENAVNNQWTNQMCKRILQYKELSSKVKDFSRELDEVYEFILTLKKVIKRL